MEIDLYQQCPCHAEKKIKFCCGKEVVGGLNDVLSRHESRQTAAALDNLDHLIKQNGPRDCLLLARSQLMMALNRLPEAEASVRQFLESNPTHSLGLERLATILAAQQKTVEAWEKLQDAMDNLPDPKVPVAFSNGFRYVGLALLSEGYPMAARVHSGMACFLEQSNPAQDQLSNAVANFSSSLLLRRNFGLEQLPADAPETEWKKKYVNAVRAQNRGQYQKAIQLVGKALAIAPEDNFLLRAAANVAALHPDYSRFISAQRTLASCESLAIAERVEAEMLAQFFSPPAKGALTDTLKLTWNVKDMEAYREKVTGNDRLIEIDVPDLESEDGGEQPPPRSAYVVLDRAVLDDISDSLNHDDIPVVLAQILVFGRQTDREARLEILLSRDGKFQSTSDWLQQLFGASIEPAGEEIIGETETETESLNAAWHLPVKTTRQQHERLTQQRQFHLAQHVLPELKFAVLDGKSLRDAAKDQALSIRCHAIVCNLELSNDARQWAAEWGQEARRAIGLSEIPKIPGDAVQDKGSLSPFLVRFVELDGMPTQLLTQLFSQSMYAGDFRGVRLVAPMLLERDDLGLTPESTDGAKSKLHLALADLSADDDKCFEHVVTARQLAKKSGQPVGLVLVREFEQCLLRGKFARLQSILREIEVHHMNEKNVREALTNVLASYGLISPDGSLSLPAGEEEAQPSAESGVWTPESASKGNQSKSGLWIPGQ